MSRIAEVVDGWRADDELVEKIVHIEVLPATGGLYDELEPMPHPAVAARLGKLGIERLYRHQVAAIRHIRGGDHTVVVAGTASGKSLCYQLPVAETVSRDPASTALALYPTKALSQDQLGGFAKVGTDELIAATYDGDTPRDQRTWVRRNANVVLTNPDMLHVGILPHHARWKHFLSNLKFVIVDEIHSFKGIFGSHVGLIIRRLRRIAAHYGATPTFVMASATIGNPEALASALSGLDVVAIEQDTSPQGEKIYVLWNPELEDEARGIRSSPLTEATNVFAGLVNEGLHTIVFSRSRKASELMFRWARDRVDEDKRRKIAPYRGGYLAADRRRIESDLFSGKLLGVTATNALELGIDVGGLDASIITTFPGTISSFRQQAGRSGRSQATSLAVLVGGQDALDQHYMHHPDELFNRTAEAAVVNVTNPDILVSHVRCAAHEAPLMPDDAAFLGPEFEELVPDLVAGGELGLREGRLYWAGGGAPARSVNIRTSGGPTYQIIDEQPEHLGSIDEGRAFTQCHVGAVYLHQGDSYLVETLDLDHHEVLVRRGEVGYYTQPKVDKDLLVTTTKETGRLGSLITGHGTVQVTSEILAYQRKSISTGEIIDLNPVDLPSRSFGTQAVWFGFPIEVIDGAGIDHVDLPGTMHAIEHTAIAMLPLYAICDRWDVGGLSSALFPHLEGPGFYIYDGYPGGAGIAPIAYGRAAEHFTATLQALEECPCAAGCPSCVQSPKCGNFNEPLDKAGAIAVLSVALT